MSRDEIANPNSRTRRGSSSSERQTEQVEKLPDSAPPDAERGERHAEGKAIATGGKSATGTGHAQGKDATLPIDTPAEEPTEEHVDRDHDDDDDQGRIVAGDQKSGRIPG